MFLGETALGAKPAKYLLCSGLNTCAKMLNWHLGLQIHSQIVRCGYEDNVILNAALVDFYAKCGAMEGARRVFDGMKWHDQVSWTSIISGYAQNGNGIQSILLFKTMLGSCTRPNCFTYVSVISACSGLEGSYYVEQGRLFHAHVIQLAVRRDVIIYNSMISACSQNLYYEEVLELLMRMRRENFTLTDHSLSTILKACGSLAMLLLGNQLHSLAMKVGSVSNVFVASALIDMYANCGSVDEARRVFDQTDKRNSVLWTSMVSGYARSGRGSEGLELFDRLEMEEELVLDHICFTAILSACNHAGFLDRGVEYFEKMKKGYDLVPKLDHYACLVDLYARKGYLKEAKRIMEEMPFAPNDVILSSFLSSCKMYGVLELARETFNKLFKMQPYDRAACVVMMRVYAEAGLWDEVAEIRKLVKQQEISKVTGWSWVEVDDL
ncbi:hypothetical protein Dimus_019133 [Dionaea muscipula]